MDETNNYKAIDSVLAIILYLFVMLVAFSTGRIIISFPEVFNTDLSIFLILGISNLSIMAILLLFCHYRKQSIRTIGIRKDNIAKSLAIGGIVSIIIIIDKGVLSSVSFSTIKDNGSLIVMKIIHFLIFVALTEEVVFRGYISSRLIHRNRKLSVLISGIMFSLMHIPFNLVINQISLATYISGVGLQLVTMVIAHVLLQWLYSKYDNFAGPTLIHFVLNFSGWLVELK